jgi:hypothetical protein
LGGQFPNALFNSKNEQRSDFTPLFLHLSAILCIAMQNLSNHVNVVKKRVTLKFTSLFSAGLINGPIKSVGQCQRYAEENPSRMT